MINAKLQNIIDTKSAIGNAIVNKGGTITSETPFFNYAAQIDGISTGTPQTIFAASDGSKWALTNAVNLVNDAGNVTHDFNYWQPANNSTSDPILNIGTVGANISGNIRLVPVNQVNIAQYENIVINDTTGAKYVGYNGYDANTNPTPTGNVVFNRWLLNNSASGTIIFANTTITNGGTFNGPNTFLNAANMAFVGNTAGYGGSIKVITINNGFVYAGGLTNQTVQKFGESNLTRVGNTVSYGGEIQSITTNNGFIYVGGYGETSNGKVQVFRQDNLARVVNSAVYAGGYIHNIAVNNGFVYVGGYGANFGNASLSKYHESNLAFVGNTASYNGAIFSITINNGFIYVGGDTNQTVQKFHESNLVRVGSTPNYGGTINTLKTNNGFIYAGGDTNRTVQKFYESNLAFVGNTANYGGTIFSVTTNNGFIYVGGATDRTVQKFDESNLAFVGNTANYGGTINTLKTNDGFIYVGGFDNLVSPFTGTVQKFQEQSLTLDNQTFYTATKIKE
jgi:hypothetical protein